MKDDANTTDRAGGAFPEVSGQWMCSLPGRSGESLNPASPFVVPVTA